MVVHEAAEASAAVGVLKCDGGALFVKIYRFFSSCEAFSRRPRVVSRVLLPIRILYLHCDSIEVICSTR